MGILKIIQQQILNAEVVFVEGDENICLYWVLLVLSI